MGGYTFADIWNDIFLPCLAHVWSIQKSIWDAIGGFRLIQLAFFSLVAVCRIFVARFNGGWTWNKGEN